MTRQARKEVLATAVITEVCSSEESGAEEVVCQDGTTYFRRPLTLPTNNLDVAQTEHLPSHQFNLLPVVLTGSGEPWAEANIYIIQQLADSLEPEIRTFDGYALDLAAYRRFIEQESLDWTKFPQNKLARPTYRYRHALNLEFSNGKISKKLLRRRLGTMINFYRSLIREKLLSPEYPPWEEHDTYISKNNKYGGKTLKKVTTTDLAVSIPEQSDPFSEYIKDGGNLRPLPYHEQDALIKALELIGNTEMTLMITAGMLTGGRLQTICTLQVRHVTKNLKADEDGYVRVPMGLGTGIDTKLNKKNVLHIPLWFYELLATYAGSERARNRRNKNGRDCEDQYLFLTKYGTPFYSNKVERQAFNPNNKRRYDFDGGAVGTFVRNQLRPLVKKLLGIEDFKFNFHDTKATFGMNLSDEQLELVKAGKKTLAAAREYIRMRMSHEKGETTDLYLKYRQERAYVRKVISEHEAHLKSLIERAMSGNP